MPKKSMAHREIEAEYKPKIFWPVTAIIAVLIIVLYTFWKMEILPSL